jgi:type I restriction enzyme S subunit
MSAKMKASGIEWIGDIPENWRIERLKDIVEINNDSLLSNTKKDFVLQYIEISNVDNQGIISKDNIKELTFEDAPSRAKRIIYEGDTIVSSVRPNLQALAYINSNEPNLICSTGFFTNRVIYNKKHDKKFAYYFLLSEFARQSFISFGKGVGYPAVSDKDYCTLKVVYPKYVEQKQIADFLDEATSKIDKAIKTKKAQLKSLEKLKKSIIHKAVTKGLDDGVSMKESGVEWIGDIPMHWKTQIFKRTSSIKARIGWQGLTSEEYRTKGKHLLVTGTDFKGRYINWNTCHYVDEERYDEDTKIQLKDKDILVTKDGTIGKISMVKNMKLPTTLNSGIFVTRPLKNDYIQEYMYWVLTSDMLIEFIEYSKVGSTIAHLYQKTFERFKYPLPKINEQEKIVEYLEIEVEKINTLKENVTKQVKKLEEYKKSLIYEYVTGKKQV